MNGTSMRATGTRETEKTKKDHKAAILQMKKEALTKAIS